MTNTQTKHTLGPWEIFSEPSLNKIRIQKDDGIIPSRTIAQLSCNQDNPSKYEQEANAALIAAAPELLEALEKLFECHLDATGQAKRKSKADIEDYYRGVERKTRAAIAKAKGE